MAFVFEAKKLPFDAQEDPTTTAQVYEWIGEDAARLLTPWQRCILAAVLPVVLQRPLPTAQQARTSADARDGEDGEVMLSSAAVENKNENGDIIVHENTTTSASPDSAQDAAGPHPSRALRKPDVEDLDVAHRIMSGLDDLEAAYAHAVDVRQSMQAQSAHGAGLASHTPLTAEEIIMAELLRERGGDEAVAGFFAVTRPLNGDEDGATTDVDLAMCFDLSGNPIGIGAPVVFGGHGYHPEP